MMSMPKASGWPNWSVQRLAELERPAAGIGPKAGLAQRGHHQFGLRGGAVEQAAAELVGGHIKRDQCERVGVECAEKGNGQLRAQKISHHQRGEKLRRCGQHAAKKADGHGKCHFVAFERPIFGLIKQMGERFEPA